MFLNYMNAFRAIAIIFIVAIHSMHVFSWDNNLAQEKILRIIVGNGTILFLFISGYLFQHLSLKFSTKKYYLSKFKNVLLPYFIISLPIVLYFVFISPKHTMPELISQPQWLQVLYYYWWGLHIYTMWFIPVITLFFIAGPVFYQLDKIKSIYWLLPVLVMVSIAIPRSLFPTENFLHYLSIYVFGMFCSRYKDKVNPVVVKNSVISLLSLIFVSLFLIEYFALAPSVTINYLQKLPAILIMLGILIKFEAYTKHPFIVSIANASFGIYFVHTFVLVAFKTTSSFFNAHFLSNHYTYIPGNASFLILASTGVLLVSILVVSLIKNVLGDKTFLLIGHIPTLKTTQK